MLLAIEQTAPEWGGNRLLINTLSIDDADNAVRRLLSQRPDGIIFTGMGLRRVTLPEALAGIPVVLANGVPIPQQVAVLGYDNLVGVGELFLPPSPRCNYPIANRAIRRLCILLTGGKIAG